MVTSASARCFDRLHGGFPECLAAPGEALPSRKGPNRPLRWPQGLKATKLLGCCISLPVLDIEQGLPGASYGETRKWSEAWSIRHDGTTRDPARLRPVRRYRECGCHP